MLTAMSSKSPAFRKQPRCLNLNVVKASQSQKKREAISDDCLHLSHFGLFTSLSSNRCPFKWHCPIRNPVIILRWFPLRLRNSPAFLGEGLLSNPLASLCPRMDCQRSLGFLLVQSLTPLANFGNTPRAGWSPMSACEEPSLANWSAISFPSNPMSPVTFCQFHQGLMAVPD